MDWQTIINIGAGALLGVGGWFARQLWDSVNELKNDVSAIRLSMSENYVKKSEIENFKADMDKIHNARVSDRHVCSSTPACVSS